MDFPLSKYKKSKKNLVNLSSIPEGSIPLNRGLGLSWRALSQIPPSMENDYAVNLIEKVEEFESRVSVDEVAFRYDGEGNVIVDVTLERRDKEDEH